MDKINRMLGFYDSDGNPLSMEQAFKPDPTSYSLMLGNKSWVPTQEDLDRVKGLLKQLGLLVDVSVCKVGVPDGATVLYTRKGVAIGSIMITGDQNPTPKTSSKKAPARSKTVTKKAPKPKVSMDMTKAELLDVAHKQGLYAHTRMTKQAIIDLIRKRK